jgi:hypothetical protein
MEAGFRPPKGKKLALFRTRGLEETVEDRRQLRIDVSSTTAISDLNGFRL